MIAALLHMFFFCCYYQSNYFIRKMQSVTVCEKPESVLFIHKLTMLLEGN